jgi:ubiquitin carboxyl-terminal hydrolase MINDY-1/2
MFLEGMDLNPVFIDAHGFRPQMRKDLDGGEGLELFSHANISLVHGWLVDPSSPEYEAVQRAGDYDNSVNVVVEADHLAQGRLVVDEDETAGSSSGVGSGSKQGDVWTPEERTKVEDGILFLNVVFLTYLW